MQRAEKREDEMASGRALLNLLNIEAVFEAGQVPAPDLVFQHNGKRVGVEHTRVFAENGSNAGSFQAYEKMLEDLARQCEVAYVNRSLPPVEVKLHLSSERFSKARLSVLVDWIVGAVAANPHAREIRNDWTGDMPHEINSIHIYRFATQAKTSFFAPRAAWIQTLESTWLQNKVEEKAKHMDGYLRSGCTEVWLLIVEEQTGLANTLEVPESFWSQPIRHRGFERIYYLRRKTDLHRLPSGDEEQEL